MPPTPPASATPPGRALRAYVVPGLPHPLVVPERNAGWQALRQAFESARAAIARLEPDLLLLYSTQWISVIGHQIQADPEPEWCLVDPEWHALGDLPYRFRMDAAFADQYQQAAQARGLHARTVAYHGFPIDTGTVVALKLLDPQASIPACVVSCNMYADRAETVVLGKAARDALRRSGRRAVVVAVSGLSNRMFTRPIDPADDHIASPKDDEWNRKLLEIFAAGRLDDVVQLARTFSQQADADQKLKAIWWLAGVMGSRNDYEGRVLEYRPIYGTGAAVVELTPSQRPAANLEFDEDDVEVFGGDREVLAASAHPSPSPTAGGAPQASSPAREAPGAPEEGPVRTSRAPAPVGAYPHARRVGTLLYLSGVGPRQPGSDAIPGGPIRDAQGNPLEYDIEAQTRAVIDNVRVILEDSGSSLDRVRDVTVFLVDMQRDFEAFNRVYTEAFADIAPTRTTLEVRALPTPIAVEFKVIAEIGDDAPGGDA